MNSEMEDVVQKAVVDIADSLLIIGQALQAIAAVIQHDNFDYHNADDELGN